MTQAVQIGPLVSRSNRDTVPLARLARAELRWIFRRPRTLIVLGLLAAVPVVIGLALTLVNANEVGDSGDAGVGTLLVSAVSNGFILPIAALVLTLQLLLPLATAMAGADAIAGETATGALRGWQLAPVSRGRLLAVKAFGVATVALATSVVMTVTGAITGLIINGSDSLFTLSGTTLSLWETLGRLALAAGWVTLQLWAVGAVALAISAFTEHPMLVVVSILTADVVFQILSLLSAVSWLHPFLLQRNWSTALTEILQDPMNATQLGEGALRAVCYIVIGLSVAYARMTTRDG